MSAICSRTEAAKGSSAHCSSVSSVARSPPPPRPPFFLILDDLEFGNVDLAGLDSEICLSLSSRCWDQRGVSPCLAFEKHFKST